MTLYAILMPEPGSGALPQAVPEKFSWFAALLPPVHALVHRLWDQLVLFILGLAAIVVAQLFIGADATIWLYILLALACGFAAPGAQRRAWRRRGYLPAGHRLASDGELARLAVLETRA